VTGFISWENADDGTSENTPMDTSHASRNRSNQEAREARALSHWQVIRAARAFYGRPLEVAEIKKIKHAQAVLDSEMAGERSAPHDMQRVQRTRQSDVEQPSIERAF